MELTPAPLRLLVVAGEASGDLHGGALLQQLRSRLPEAQILGVGGERMRAAGLLQLADVRHLSAAGVVEILGAHDGLGGERARIAGDLTIMGQRAIGSTAAGPAISSAGR